MMLKLTNIFNKALPLDELLVICISGTQIQYPYLPLFGIPSYFRLEINTERPHFQQSGSFHPRPSASSDILIRRQSVRGKVYIFFLRLLNCFDCGRDLLQPT